MAATKRINKYDNLKGLAIILIVLGHLDYLNVINPFHLSRFFFLIDLPIFFFVAGYFSKIAPDQPLKSFKRLMIPYFLFCFLIELFRFLYTGSSDWDLIFIQSSMAMWFLISLFIMKMILPILDKLKYPIIITFIIALLFGVYDFNPNYLALTRTFSYLPIFLFGFYFNRYMEDFSKAYGKLYGFFDRHFKLIVLAVCLVTVVVVFKFNGKFFVFKDPYSGNLLYEAIKKGIVLVLEIAWMVILNRIMTNKDCFLTKIGRNSMAVYVLHPFIYYIFKPIWPVMITSDVISIVLSIVLTAITVFVLSRDFVTKYLNMIVDGIFNIFFRPSSL